MARYKIKKHSREGGLAIKAKKPKNYFKKLALKRWEKAKLAV